MACIFWTHFLKHQIIELAPKRREATLWWSLLQYWQAKFPELRQPRNSKTTIVCQTWKIVCWFHVFLLTPPPCGPCLGVSDAVKRHHGHSNSYKGKRLSEVVAYGFRGSVRYHRGWEANMVLENSTYWSKGTRRKTRHWTTEILSIYETSKLTSTVTHFLQQDHTYFNKVTPPKSATSFGDIFFQTTTPYTNGKSITLES